MLIKNSLNFLKEQSVFGCHKCRCLLFERKVQKKMPQFSFYNLFDIRSVAFPLGISGGFNIELHQGALVCEEIILQLIEKTDA